LHYLLLLAICGYVLWPFRTKIPAKDPKQGLRKLKNRLSDLESDVRRLSSDQTDSRQRLDRAIGRWSAQGKADKKVEADEAGSVIDMDAVNEAIKEGTYKG